jgi:hypothetical protein
LPGDAEADCVQNKGEAGNSDSMLSACNTMDAYQRRCALQGRRRDMASHGKESQHRAARKAAGIDGTVRLKLL